LMAVWRRGKPGALMHHSDRGSQGGFNRSSQHFDKGGCDEGPQACFGSVYTQEVAFAWTSARVAA
jgi:putative transposase